MNRKPRRVRSKDEHYHKWTKEEDMLVAEFMCLPTNSELADMIGVSLNGFYERKSNLRRKGKLAKLMDKIRNERKGDNFIFKI